MPMFFRPERAADKPDSTLPTFFGINHHLLVEWQLWLQTVRSRVPAWRRHIFDKAAVA